MYNFLELARNKHLDRYDYSGVKYVNSRTKVDIICNKHGLFKQVPSSHLRGNGCSACFNESRKNNKIISQFILKHGNKYDYSRLEYINNTSKVEILCLECQKLFKQTPKSHRNGNGCPFCVGRHQSNEEIIDRFIARHADRYDYSNVDYTKANKKVQIICKEHGVFYQLPSNHLNGNDCPRCSHTKSLGEFISKSIEIHGDIYDYSQTIYLKSLQKVIILCKGHGPFRQRPNCHLRGVGCPSCSSSKGESKINKFLISNGLEFKRQFKFEGCRNKNKLPFDFYIPSLDICIEFDGEQHFKPNTHFGGIDSYNRLKINDAIKDDFCQKNNIKLIRIKYHLIADIDGLLRFYLLQGVKT